MHGRHRAAETATPDDAATAQALLDALELIGSAEDLDGTLRRLAAVGRALAQASYAVVELCGSDAPDLRVAEGTVVEGGHERLHADLRTRGVLLGRIVVGRPEEAFVDEDRRLVDRLAGLSGSLVVEAMALEDRDSTRERMLTADRGRIARDLHDLVIQRLYATGLHLQAAKAGDHDSVGSAISTAVRDIDTAIRDVRATIFELSRGPARSLAAEARALVEEYAPALGFTPALRISGPVDTVLVESVADEALLVLREALSNVARHAQASTVQVELTASPAWFMLRVTDDGVGIPPRAGIASGLRNAGRRAATRGGVMRTGDVTPHGTSLVWLVPASS
ncbi:Histidine kinase-like ATPase domain-containing protein [Nocardioides terrae]|uniref:Histidine kinase-like ATPase domain-containing protein n=1 Tax=Nocardioides terrae TaxID=574651 RepID=A0A1I1KKG9_9ACTN|nr:histidine kinase [Nocardioides terrae]SFC61297.1 Histidine kinase-like ATPase domain-containing protein [Nocardioides terrae]